MDQNHDSDEEPASEVGPVGDYRMNKHQSNSASDQEYYDSNAAYDYENPTTPPPNLPSPSIISSIHQSPTSSPSPYPHTPSNNAAKERSSSSRSNIHSGRESISPSSSRLALARRLSHLAHQLTIDQNDEAVDGNILDNQVGELEKSLSQASSPRGNSQHQHQRSGRLDIRSLDQIRRSSVLSSPPSSLSRSQFSHISASPGPEETETERQHDREGTQTLTKGGPSSKRLDIISELTRLNDELQINAANLQARQEESNHIHSLLIERAERAAQRIIFLQTRIAYLEQELRDNDDEVQHLRICLKAVEVQLPPHPDPDIQRCIAAFKHEYQVLKQKRVNRNLDPASNNQHYQHPHQHRHGSEEEDTTGRTDMADSPSH